MAPNEAPVPPRRPLSARLAAVSLRDLLVVVLPALSAAVLLVVVVQFVRPAPPDTIRLLSGPEGSTYRTNAERYKKIIEGYGVKVEVIASQGALANLQALADHHVHADVGFVQDGLTDGVNTAGLISLGSLFAQPLMVYYRGPQPIELLSQLRGKRLAIGPEGSGTRALALKLLAANGITAQTATLDTLSGEDAARALVAGTIDGAFLMGDSATPKVMSSLRAAPGITLMSFRQAAGYVRRFRFLSRLTLPEGSLDFASNYPPQSYDLVGPTVELVARKDLHPALSDLLIAAAREVHGGPALFRDAGEYPAPLAKDFPIGADAERYYKSGGQFLYKRLPFWMASLVDRTLVVILPLLVLIVPASRLAPAVYRWRVRSRIYRWYGALMALEREGLARPTEEHLQEILGRLDDIQASINEVRTPLAYADQLFILREHIQMVRNRLSGHRRPQG
jgi:TRAP-type uncharacterized transport system substrate-binding protein